MTRKRVLKAAAPCVFVAVLTVSLVLTTSRAMASDTPLFLPAVTYDTGGYVATAVAVADVNGDGKPDLMVANLHSYSCLSDCFDGSVGVLLGNGDGTFRSAAIYGSGGWNATGIAVADVNGDGKFDLLVTNSGGIQSSVGVLLGNGDGTFQPTVAYGTGGGVAFGLAIADVNGDHKLDLLVANIYSNTIGVLLGNGDGTFKAAVTYDSGGPGLASIVVADVNSDGRSDLVVANCGIDTQSCPPLQAVNGVVGVLLGNGDGTFQPAVVYDSGGSAAAQIAVADVNGDGKLDLLVENAGCCFIYLNGVDSSVGILLGNGDGTFRPAVPYYSGGRFAQSMATADVNADSKLDILVANPCGPACAGLGSVGVLLANGDGTFQSHINYYYQFGVRFVIVADVNGDGKADLALTETSGALDLLLGNGDGTFEATATYDPGGQAVGPVVVTDLNRDSKPDFVVAESCRCTPARGLVGVLLNNMAFDTTPPLITLSIAPKLSWPPNGKRAPVTVSGTITDTGSGVNAATATYAVKDEYGEVQPTGAISLGPGGSYSFTVLLQASRRGSDLDGRGYTITVRAKDNAGNGGSKTVVVTVPHDQGH